MFSKEKRQEALARLRNRKVSRETIGTISETLRISQSTLTRWLMESTATKPITRVRQGVEKVQGWEPIHSDRRADVMRRIGVLVPRIADQSTAAMEKMATAWENLMDR